MTCYYFEDHGYTNTQVVADFCANYLVTAAKSAGLDDNSDGRLFDSSHSIVHWTNDEYQDCCVEWMSEKEGGANLIILRVSTGGQQELRETPHVKWERDVDGKRHAAYVLCSRNQDVLKDPAVAEAFFRMTPDAADALVQGNLTALEPVLQPLFVDPHAPLLTALAVLCQGYLLAQGLQPPVMGSDTGKWKPACSRPPGQAKSAVTAGYWQVFPVTKPEALLKSFEGEWRNLSGKELPASLSHLVEMIFAEGGVSEEAVEPALKETTDMMGGVR